MKKLHFVYSMQIDYDEEVKRCHFTIKCIPQTNARQTVESCSLQLYPDVSYNQGMDGLGNLQIYGLDEIPHDTFRFSISGDVTTGLAEYEKAEEDGNAMIFRHPYGLNKAGENIQAYYCRVKDELQKKYQDELKGNLQIAKEIMHCLHRDFHYEQYRTTVQTGAEEAFAMGCGVCQDYAHIMLALLHLEGMAARYVTGLLIGEGASHAWVEVLCDQKWYGLDPTNDVEVGEDHIRIGCGRDAGDCMINRGIMHGGGRQRQQIQASVYEV